jgi:hypothetical protein
MRFLRQSLSVIMDTSKEEVMLLQTLPYVLLWATVNEDLWALLCVSLNGTPTTCRQLANMR